MRKQARRSTVINCNKLTRKLKIKSNLQKKFHIQTNMTSRKQNDKTQYTKLKKKPKKRTGYGTKVSEQQDIEDPISKTYSFTYLRIYQLAMIIKNIIIKVM